MKITKKDIILNRKLYEEYEKLKMSDGWNEGEKEINYGSLTRISELSKIAFFNAKVLDVGCGTGDLSAFLRLKNIADYIGIDIFEPAIKLAKQKYPNEKFIMGDLLTGILDDYKFDFTFCSGGLTTKIHSDNYIFLTEMLQKMSNLTLHGIAFNILTDEDREPDEDLFSYNQESVIKICKSIKRFSNIHIEKNSIAFQSNFYLY